MLRISRINTLGIIKNIIKTNHHVLIRNYTLKYSPPLDIPEKELNERLLKIKKLLENYNTHEIDAINTSGMYTKFGWFYIPLIYNQLNKSSEIIANELTNAGATLNTPHEEIQNFIDQWCNYNLPIKPEKPSKKTTTNSVDDLFESSIHKMNIESSDSVKENGNQIKQALKLIKQKEKDEIKLIKQQERLNKQNLKKDEKRINLEIKKINQEELKISNRIANLKSKIIVKLNQNSGNYEILSKINKRHLNGYYCMKRLYELTKNQNKSFDETKEIIKQEWLSIDKITIKNLLNEFTQMLINGNDIYKGELIPLEKTLSEPSVDGTQTRIGIMNIAKEEENSPSLK